MSHSIRAFIGHRDMVDSLAKKWLKTPIQLNQELSMLYLTDELFDDITEKIGLRDNPFSDIFSFLNSSIISVLEEYSQHGKLAYCETDYFGGAGTQAALLYENGRQKSPPILTTDNYGAEKAPVDKRAINKVLKEFGIKKTEGKDEFDSVGLGDFRNMSCINNGSVFTIQNTAENTT